MHDVRKDEHGRAPARPPRQQYAERHTYEGFRSGLSLHFAKSASNLTWYRVADFDFAINSDVKDEKGSPNVFHLKRHSLDEVSSQLAYNALWRNLLCGHVDERFCDVL